MANRGLTSLAARSAVLARAALWPGRAAAEARQSGPSLILHRYVNRNPVERDRELFLLARGERQPLLSGQQEATAAGLIWRFQDGLDRFAIDLQAGRAIVLLDGDLEAP